MQSLGIGSRVSHPDFGTGVVIQINNESYLITFIEHGTKTLAKTYPSLEIIEAVETPDDMFSFSEIERRFINIIRDFSDLQEIVPIADKWRGGKMILQPSDKNMQGKEIPISTFFHKIVMVRDRLRVMEQRINASELSDEEKVNLQQYITRIYGSLTTFNILFKTKEHHFSGSGE